MSRLDKLIRELCPDGVPFVRMGDIYSIKGRVGWQRLTKDEYRTEGEYYLVTGTDFTANHSIDFSHCYYVDKERYDQDENIQLKNGDIIITKDGTIGKVAIVSGMDKPATLNSHLLLFRDRTGCVMNKFLLHILLSDVFLSFVNKCATKGTIVGLPQKTVSEFRLPVPPLPVQNEIVSILDNFLELTEKLSGELIARQKQYEYYRNSLLAFDNSVPQICLEDLCTITAGGDAPKKEMSEEKTNTYTIPIISNGVGDNAFYGYTKNPKVIEPAVTVAARGTIGYAEYRDYPYYPIVRLLSVIPRDTSVLNTRFLFYCLKGKEYKVPTTGIPQLTAPMLKKVTIPVPGIDVQNKIVNILDRFDSICSDTDFGLPAEIEARTKQYKYYREKLLSFQEVSCQ